MACYSGNSFDKYNEPEKVVAEYESVFENKKCDDYSSNPGDMFGPKSISQTNKAMQRVNKPTINSNCEYLILKNEYRDYRGQTRSVKAAIEEVVRGLDADLKGVHYIMPEPYIGLYSYGILVAHKEGLDKFREELCLDVMGCIVFLEGAYCSNCFKSGHSHLFCENCSICREKHFYRTCPSLDTTVRQLMEELMPIKDINDVSAKTRRRKNAMTNKGLPDAAPHVIPYFKIGKDKDGVDVKYGDCAIDCENGHTTGMAVCLRVAISAKVDGIGNCLIYTAFVNNSEEVLDHSPTVGGINANDVIHLGKHRMTVREDVLEVLKGHRVYGFNSKVDFMALYIKNEDLKWNDIQVIDFHEMPRFKDLNGIPNNRTSLRRLHYCYSLATKRTGLLQEYDHKFRRVPSHSAHLDAKATLDLGQSYEKVSKKIRDEFKKDENFKGTQLGIDLHFDFDTIKIRVDHDISVGLITPNPYAKKLWACAQWANSKKAKAKPFT